MDRLYKHIISIVMAGFLVISGVYSYAWYNEPSPYGYIKVYVQDNYTDDEELKIAVSLFRNKLCPYILERTIYDSEGTKIFDQSIALSTPSKLGSDKFNSNIKYSLFDSKPSIGEATYSVRVLSKCNVLQTIIPSETPWTVVEFRFKERNNVN